MCHHPVARCWSVLKALWHDYPLPNHPNWYADRSERNITVPHEDLIKPICQIDGAENLAAGHGIQYHVFAWSRRLSRDRGFIELVKSMHNAPIAGGFLHTESRTRPWQDTFANMACLTAIIKIHQLRRLDQVVTATADSHNTSILAQEDLVPHSTIRWKLSGNFPRKDIGILASDLVDRFAQSTKGFPRQAAIRSSYKKRADLGSALFVRASRTSSLAASAAETLHTCSMSPALTSRRKSFHGRPDRDINSIAVHGGLATSM